MKWIIIVKMNLETTFGRSPINVLKNARDKKQLGHFNYLRAEFGRVTNYEVLEKILIMTIFIIQIILVLKNIGSKNRI